MNHFQTKNNHSTYGLTPLLRKSKNESWNLDRERENEEEITLRKLGDGRGTNELHKDEVRVGDRLLQLRLESYKGWARVRRRASGVGLQSWFGGGLKNFLFLFRKKPNILVFFYLAIKNLKFSNKSLKTRKPNNLNSKSKLLSAKSQKNKRHLHYDLWFWKNQCFSLLM